MKIYITLFFANLLIVVAGQLMLKSGMKKIGNINLFSDGFRKNVHKMFTNKTVISGVLLFGISLLLWIVIVSGLELSYIYPMVSLAYVLVALSSKMLFKEEITKLRWASIFIIIAGVILVSTT